ncbi:TMV resistance protein N-like [Rosa chinensis]|uniref:TMV resistance protein N-like n=1 Tax=Rosa chinensis TaxID=74649 RepID=UPI001AD8D207|nr:TMV resistance protein N-like [Rosa chinensis]
MPSWSSFCRQKHDVFLSFRGEDTRLNFTDHLYAALIQCGISTFRDDKDLEKGMSIRKQLGKAIEGSKVWVVIVSPNYASSKWCLNELLKILECRKASKVGKKNETLMKPFEEYEEQTHTLLNGDKTHKGKASLRNKENITNHNKKEMGEFRFGVNYGGKWVGSVYIGGETKEIVVSEDITYNELLDQLYHIVGVHPNENEIKISTIDNQNHRLILWR